MPNLSGKEINHDSKLVLGDSITVSPSQGNIVVGTLGTSPLVAKIDATPIHGMVRECTFQPKYQGSGLQK